MAASNEWFEYHLTPRGWEAGSDKTDFSRSDAPTPQDRVLTIVRHEFMSSSFSPLERWITIEWTHPDASAVASLREKFGKWPPGSDSYRAP